MGLFSTRRPSKTTATEPPAPAPTVDKKPSFGSVAPGEAAAINDLLRQTTGGSDMAPLRVRRKSKEDALADGAVNKTGVAADAKVGSMDVTESWKHVSSEETHEILNLVRQASAGGDDKAARQVLRERRMSKDLIGGAAKEVKHEAPSAQRPTRRPSKEVFAPVSLPPPDVSDVTSEPSTSPVPEDMPVGSPTPEDGSFLSNASTVLINENSGAFKGAAARGARRAEIATLKAAVAEHGLKLMTPEEWEAVRQEIKLLQVKNKRLEEELIALKHGDAAAAAGKAKGGVDELDVKVNSGEQPASVAASPMSFNPFAFLARALPGGSPSPTRMRSSISPFGKRGSKSMIEVSPPGGATIASPVGLRSA